MNSSTAELSDEQQGNKHFNLMLFIGALIGATVGFFIGEFIIFWLSDKINAVWLVGLYFAQLMFFIFFAVLLCEKADPRLNTRIWTADNWKNQLLRLPLMSIVVFFCLGCILQFLYGLSSSKTMLQKSDNYIIAIDNSGSMASSDPGKERFQAVESFVNELDETNSVSVILFSDTPNEVVPLTQVDNNLRLSIRTTLSELEPDGGTRIGAALEKAAQIPVGTGQKSMVILLSDGEDVVDVNQIASLYSKSGLVLNTIDFSGNQLWRNRMLLNLSTSTGGMNYQISEMNQLAGTFTKILSGSKIGRNLLDYRYGFDRDSRLFMTLRILFITLIGIAMSGALAVMLYNLDVLKKLLLSKIVTGLLAGLVLEFFLLGFWPAPAVRLITVLLLGTLITFFRSMLSDLSASKRSNNLATQTNQQW